MGAATGAAAGPGQVDIVQLRYPAGSREAPNKRSRTATEQPPPAVCDALRMRRPPGRHGMARWRLARHSRASAADAPPRRAWARAATADGIEIGSSRRK
eukprot:SAG31_NODE_1556_length_7893_cov_1.993585_9_plen_99_part_00